MLISPMDGSLRLVESTSPVWHIDAVRGPSTPSLRGASATKQSRFRHSGMVRKHQTSDVQLHIGESRDSGFDASHRPGMTKRCSLSQPLIPGVFRGFTGGLGGGFRRALAAGNLDRLAPRNLVAGIGW